MKASDQRKTSRCLAFGSKVFRRGEIQLFYYKMQRTPISTAKFQAAGSIEATVTGFDTSSLVVQSLND